MIPVFEWAKTVHALHRRPLWWVLYNSIFFKCLKLKYCSSFISWWEMSWHICSTRDGSMYQSLGLRDFYARFLHSRNCSEVGWTVCCSRKKDSLWALSCTHSQFLTVTDTDKVIFKRFNLKPNFQISDNCTNWWHILWIRQRYSSLCASRFLFPLLC
jgi:hypothetical protein